MRLTAAVCGLAALALATSVNAAARATTELWNGATAGMNIDQIAALFPQGKVLTGQMMEGGAVSAYTTAAELGGAPADAVFFFRDKTLDAVLVERRRVPDHQSAANLADVQRLIAAATAEYGRPGRCVERPQIAAASCTWTIAGLRVAIGYHDFGGASPGLSVVYRNAPR